MKKELHYLIKAATALVGKIQVMNGCQGTDFDEGHPDEWPEFVKLRVAVEKAERAAAFYGHGPEEWYCVISERMPKPGAFYATHEEAQAHVDSWRGDGGNGQMRVARIREMYL